MKDIRDHWAEWRADWEHKLQQNEIQFLRSVADLQGSFQHRVSVIDASFRELMRGQHTEFMAALERHGAEIQQRLWADLERIRLEYERLIHSELRTIRQRAAMQAPAPRPDVARLRSAAASVSARSNSTTAASPSASAAPRNTSNRRRPSTCRISAGAATCSISAAGAANSWS